MFNLLFSSNSFRTLSHDDLFLLLIQSRKNNQKLNVTGILLYSCRRFVQLLEGEEQVVQELYSKIKTDIRHKDIQLEFSNAVDSRKFQQWSMSFNDADESEKYNIPGFSRFLEDGYDTSSLCNEDDYALNRLCDFRQDALLKDAM